MEEPVSPEEDLDKELRKQERDIHGNLFHLNQLFTICCDESLSMDSLYTKCQPHLEKLKKGNPVVAHEIEALIQGQDRQKLLDYFEQEKQQLTQVLSDEVTKHQAVDKQINDMKTDRHPTDS